MLATQGSCEISFRTRAREIQLVATVRAMQHWKTRVFRAIKHSLKKNTRKDTDKQLCARVPRYIFAGKRQRGKHLLERRYPTRKEIHEIGCKNVVRTHQESITDAFADFYNQLFGKRDECDNGEMRECLERLLGLSESVQRSPDEPIHIDEIEQVLRDLPGGKVPGPDGIISDFYKHCQSFVCPFLLTSFCHCTWGCSFPSIILTSANKASNKK